MLQKARFTKLIGSLTAFQKTEPNFRLLSIASKLLTSDKNITNGTDSKQKKRRIKKSSSKSLIVNRRKLPLNPFSVTSGSTQRQQQQQFPSPNLIASGLPQLSRLDCSRRVEFATKMLGFLHKEPKMIHSIVFSDECNFWTFYPKGEELVSGPPSESNKRKTTTKKIYAESKPLPTIAWCGMTTKEIIGPYFFNAFVTGSSYLVMLRKYLLPELKSRNYDLRSTWFQQDACAPHRTSNVLSFLKETLGQKLIAYGNEPLAWPAKSSDLSPLDFFFWNYMKSKMTIYKPTTREILRECLAFEMESIDPDVLDRFARHEFIARLEKCIEVRGRRFI